MTMLHDLQLNTGPQGATAMTADTGFTTVSPTLKYDSAAAHTGPFGLMVASTETAGVAYVALSPAHTELSVGVAVYLPVIPTGSDYYLLRIGSGTGRAASVHVNSVGKMRLSDTAGTTGVWTSSQTMTPGWYVLRLRFKAGTTTSNGTLAFEVYKDWDTTPWEAGFSSTSTDTGDGADVDRVTVGKYSPGAFAVGVDEYMISDDADSFIPLIQNVLATPDVTVTATDPATIGGMGQVAGSWPVVPNAALYRYNILEGDVTTGYETGASTTTSTSFSVPKPAGTYTVVVRAE